MRVLVCRQEPLADVYYQHFFEIAWRKRQLEKLSLETYNRELTAASS
jgi:hypothetical protein